MTPCDPGRPVQVKLRIVIIGVGNAYRGDDAVGLLVGRRLREQLGPGVAYREAYGEGTTLIDTWQNADAVILIDAVRSGAAPGTIHRLNVAARPVPESFRCYSTHAFGVAEAIELARALGQLPIRCIVYGIEGENFAMGAELSVAVASAVEGAIARICQEVARWER